ncbi:UDP-N-acetylmuramoyl-tripeptide--D-alanyl-D-alanine ligase [Bacillus sp. 165]|uniref:UDP-N-acetylmuramoyl-tripeptide--D-alanyl-D- alanine ligase n=1 Tax=Bacillus sp. 165 TaxID=1529117 RepID=UPI001ADA15BB|nr:UDP-N-acetylmuramoyl-tripeptide--D-alanyl-D-alanine ligase [Bacillus sp. 165]MBO9131384.1 UDP-N-acetylmuramoyl-tripeptide--D-alanyl-D-alanine ligase [Bacillus sp. 165]
MIQRTLREIEKMAGGSGMQPDVGAIGIKGVSIDTRTIQKGNLYVPLKGERFDGHDYAHKAIENGASALLWQKDVPNPPAGIPVIFVEDTYHGLQQLAKSYRDSLSVKVIGVTGSNGKTSTKDILTSLLSMRYKVQKTEGNYNNHIGLPLTLLRLEEDTEIAVLEMGMSNFGEIEFLSRLATPDAAIITNIGESHMMELGSRAGIAQAKLEIITGLREEGIFAYNGDEPLLRERVREIRLPAKVVTFGQDSTNDLYPLSVQLGENGTVFTVNADPSVEFFLPVLGKHNVYNSLACMAVAHFFNVTWEEMKDGLRQLKMTGMRMEVVKSSSGLTVINDAYNASPTSMKAAIALINELRGYEKKIVVLGDMLELGGEEEAFHYEIGEMLDPAHIDYVFTYGNLGTHIARGARTSFAPDKVKMYLDKEELAKDLKCVVTEHDVVLVKASRGMKLEEVIDWIK